MIQLKKHCRSFQFILGGILIITLCWSAATTVTAKKADTPALAGFAVSALSPELAEDQGVPREQRGVIIMGIYQGSPAEKIGLREGDIIVQVQNNKAKLVDIADYQQYSTVADAVPAEKPLVLTVLREGKRQTLQLLRSSEKFGPINQPSPATAPRIIKVAASGAGDCKSINGALLRSRPGDSIMLMPGKYSGIFVQRNQLTLAALDPQNPPVIAGVYIAPVTGVKLKELVIAVDPTPSYNSGSGVLIDSANQISLENCQIRGFTYGVAVVSSSTGITLEANIITKNWTGVYINDLAAKIKLSHNLIYKNSGGGINAAGTVEVLNNTIIENRAPTATFNDSLYASKGKTVLGAGITIRGGNASIFNNIIAFNNVGCLIAPGSQTILEYNDVFQHVVDATAMHRVYEDIKIIGGNSNFLSEFQYVCKAVPLLSLASDQTTITPVLKFQPSATNLGSNPFFVDPQQGDYRLAADSPLATKGRGNTYIGAYPPVAPKQEVATTNQPPAFGISARPLSDLDRKSLGLVSQVGLWVTEVKKGSLAESLQIKVDDVILEINGVAFKDNEEFKKLITTTKIATVKVFRGGKELLLTPPMEF